MTQRAETPWLDGKAIRASRLDVITLAAGPDALRDLAALNKVALLPWDVWGQMEIEQDSEDSLALLDRIATLTLADKHAFDEMQAVYKGNSRLCVPSMVKSYSASGVYTAAINTWPEN